MEINPKSKFFSYSSPTRNLIELIESNAQALTFSCLKNIRSHPACPTYHSYDKEELYRRTYMVYSQLGKWISRETTKEEIADHYVALGEQRRQEGFALSEVIHALILVRRHLWLKILSEGFIDSVLDLNQALDLNNRVVLFFDRAIYYTTTGYERES